MSLDTVELWVWWLGAAAIVALSAAVTWSVLRARTRTIGRVAGQRNDLVHSPWFLVVGSVFSLALCWLLWRPVFAALPDGARIALLVAGGLLYFGGAALAAWGRVALGKMHNVSTTMGAE
jgi:hypothetical protein